MSKKSSNLITVGRITGVFGIKGWVKVKSFTEPEENILSYASWLLKTRHGVKSIEIDDHQNRPQGLIVHLKGIDDRDLAAQYCKTDIAVDRSELPELENGDYYWHQLIGLRVISVFDDREFDLGVVENMMETGANDVISVFPDEQSMDDRKRLVPYVMELYVKSVDVDKQQIQVEWDPEF